MDASRRQKCSQRCSDTCTTSWLKQAKVEPNALAKYASNDRPTYSKPEMLSSRLAAGFVPLMVKHEEVVRLWFERMT
ncbi:hypothetical protein COCC4DRAFT_127004 [Bipolaris maydis ATCC 48331]|uniref:Uncharacterized protein n=2 Tax=Cochliobolus heterostrophus TaxID=5016 RepID=M2UQG1_COCH5|nr:uncharacterized protein COCC4DRAFT_127004 [Bipolaris maydis ATCC 48331]EMD90178.1 hypothetical protein COCHEDRAFT_1195432 [Bipolaris maydis C5]ENI09611.1 hypothetical protein COCC4DRAFT_127004 [Bipolaris maydis ATCC 48331]